MGDALCLLLEGIGLLYCAGGGLMMIVIYLLILILLTDYAITFDKPDDKE